MDIIKIKDVLNNHGIISFPTETVMGLGVIYDDEEAYNRLNIVKRRKEDKPYTLMLGKPEDIQKYAYINDVAKKIIKYFMPGQITLLLKSKENIPSFVTHGTGTIGLRVPDIKCICDMINDIGKPLLVPSANRSDEKPALTSKEAKDIFKEEIQYYVEGMAVGGVPSTIVDLSKDSVRIVRKGNISLEEILEKIGE